MGLAIVLLFIFISNYRLGTYLIGWDNLMPELNIFMNIKRSLLAVWQQYQGLGLVGGMAHSTDLIRQLMILPFTLILPNSLIRYLWHFFTLALGTFGIYFGLKKHFKFSRFVCFASSLFYLLNFGTIQNYWVPFEPFSAFWGFFPWLIFSLWEYLDQPNKKNLKKLILFNIIAIPSFYVQTVFLVYILAVVAILIPHLKTQFKTSFRTFILIICLNAFWLLPFAYFLKNDVANTKLGIGNLIATTETFQRNQYRGTIPDFLLLRGYYYDFPFGNSSLMTVWQNHFSNIFVLIAGYLLGLISIFGLIKNKKKGLFILFFICAVAMLSSTPPFSNINYLIRQISILDQVFRSPFTKFIVPTIFCFTIFFAHSLQFIKNKIFNLIIVLLIFLISFPALTGNFIFPRLRQNIPNEYFALFNYFKTQPQDGRISNLPSGNYWGWTNYRSGITGSGFIWYGIKQPILDRAFDVWSLKNEQYYWELNYAIQKQDPELLNNIVKKYHISYIIFDNNVFYTDEPLYARTAIRTRNMLEQMSNLSLAGKFGQIYVYKTNIDNTFSIINNPKTIKESNFFYQDIAYLENGDYLISNNPTITYPFANLFTNRLQSENKFQIKVENDQLIINNNNFPIITSSLFSNPNPSDLNQEQVKNQEILSENGQNFIRLKSSSGNNLLGKFFPDITFDNSYIIKITYRNIANYPLFISAFGEQSRQIFFNTLLEKKTSWQTAWFIIPKYRFDAFDKSLTILFNNPTYNSSPSINDIKDISIYQIPYEDIIKTKIISPPIDQNKSYFVYHQAYHQGWLAFYFDGLKPIFLKNHVLVNNWENGWLLPITNYQLQNNIHVIFWPQILEYLGFILVSLVFCRFFWQSR